MSIGVVSHPKSFEKSLDFERPTRYTRQSNNFKGTSKSTDLKGTTKPTRTSFGVSSKSTEIKDSIKSESFSKTTRRTSDGFQNATHLKDTLKSYPKSSRKSIDVTTKATEIKNILKTEVEEISKPTKVVNTPESLDIHVDVKTISNLVHEIIDTKPTPNAKKYVEVSSDVTAISKSMIDNSYKSTKKLDKTTLEKLKIDTPPTSNKLREIDIFSTPTSKKRVESQPKSIKKPKDGTTKPDKVETSPKSMNSDVSSKRTKKPLEFEDAKKLKRKSHDAEPKSHEVDISSTFVVVEISGTPINQSVDESLQIPRKCIRKESYKAAAEDVSLKPKKKSQDVDTNLKSKIKYQSPINHKKTSSDITKSELISTKTENDVYLKSRSKSNIVSIEVPPLHLPHKTFDVEIEIPVQNTNTATADDNVTSETNTKVAQSSKKSFTSENTNTPQAVEEFAKSIKKEILPQCGVCKQQVDESLWIEHIATEHDYLAWREDEAPLVRYYYL